MSQIIRKNGCISVLLIATLLIAAMTFGNMPGPAVNAGVQVIDGVAYDFTSYHSVNKEILALFNYLNTIVSSDYQGYGEWDGWYAEDFHGLHHYVIAFMAYAIAGFFESTPGYRTQYYQRFAYDLIKKMNTTEAEWGNNSIEYKEWNHPSYNYLDYYYPNATHPGPEDLYTGGYRGPANIMWTGHYALMMAMYERNFGTGELKDELSWFLQDWNNSLTTDGFGNPKEGGIWGVGLIPCEPYIVFVQCNSIPIFSTELYDNLYNTQYMTSGMWDYGLDFANNVMQDQYDLFTDGYFVQEMFGKIYASDRLPEEYPGPQMSLYARGFPKVSSYCNAWALTFLEYTQPEATAEDYPVFMEHFRKEVSSEMSYMMDSYHNPKGFGTYDILGTLFSLPLAKQQGDMVTLQRLKNFLFGAYNKVWDGRTMHFDTMAIMPFFQPILAMAWIWAATQVNVKDLADARSPGFWEFPYISAADDDRIWIYQAEWDDAKQAFILNIEVDLEATLTFTGFNSAPSAYLSGSLLAELTPVGDDYTLTLAPGTYQLVIR